MKIKIKNKNLTNPQKEIYKKIKTNLVGKLILPKGQTALKLLGRD
jgi:transcription elongation factor GreA-like protein